MSDEQRELADAVRAFAEGELNDDLIARDRAGEFSSEYYFRPKAAWRIVRNAIFDNKERKRLYKEAREYLALRGKRKQFVKDHKASLASAQQ